MTGCLQPICDPVCKAHDIKSRWQDGLWCLVFVVLFALFATSPAQAVLNVDKREAVAKSVVQVRALGCSGGDRSGSGFVFNSKDNIVTAFHVVAGCKRLEVFFEKHGGAVLDASIERISTATDLALLAVSGSPAPPLEPASAQLQVNEEVEAIGYYLGVPSMDNKPLRVTFGNTKLFSMLSANLRNELQQRTRIDLQIEVVRLDGHLLPGLSGAPILNRNGEVVGIGSGGLQNGAASVSFAIPSGFIDGLLQSNEDTATTSYDSGLLFSAPLDLNSASARFTCGGSEFAFMGQRNIDELALTADDPTGLSQLLTRMKMPPQLVSSFLFNTYVATDTGATIAIPHWMDVQEMGSHCVATASGAHLSHLAIEFSGVAGTNVQNAALAFEQDFISRTDNTWQTDQSLSYNGPAQRFDGLIANRKAVTRFTTNDQEVAFETLMAKGNGFAGIIAHSKSWNAQQVAYCYSVNFTDPNCNNTGNALPPMFQMIIGAHLSTFPLL